MNQFPTPELSNCLRFMCAGNTRLISFQNFRDWVRLNNIPELDVDAPGLTEWQYKVPFWTKNAFAHRECFQRYEHYTGMPTFIDKATGIKLLHGYWCCGQPANGAYWTYVRSDVHQDKREWLIPQEEIDATTIGIKFYLEGKRQPTPDRSSGYVNPTLVVIASSVRVDNEGKLLCLVISISSNLTEIGGHGGGTFRDKTFHRFTSMNGWDSTEDANSWSDYFVSRRDPEGLKTVQAYHAKIFQSLLTSLASS